MKTIERIIAIITYLAVDPKFHGVTEISSELRITKSTAHRILSSLESLRWVAQDPRTERYRLGSMALQVGLSAVSNTDIRSISLPYLYDLQDNTNETAMLSLRIGSERVFIEQIQGKHEVRQIVELQKRYPIWLGAPGKVILAYMEQSEIETVLYNLVKSGVRTFASGQVLDISRLQRELAEIRRLGFTVSVGERIPEVTAVAAPIFNQNHQVVGAISVAGPISRFNVDMANNYGALVSQAARNIGFQLGDSGEKAMTET